MLKVALLATAVLLAASTAAVEKAFPEPAAAAAVPAPCRAAASPLRACALHPLDANGDGAISAAELANFASPSGWDADWASVRPEPDAGLDFTSAATEPRSVLLASLDRDRPQPLLPALFAVGALLILLRRRPT
jgi:hypothetical protein